jgi:hypothetical protein
VALLLAGGMGARLGGAGSETIGSCGFTGGATTGAGLGVDFSITAGAASGFTLPAQPTRVDATKQQAHQNKVLLNSFFFTTHISKKSLLINRLKSLAQKTFLPNK